MCCSHLLRRAAIVWFIVSAVLHAQQTPDPLRLAEYQKQEWHVEDGLPESNVRMISQREDGLLLLATFSGVSTFDGQNFQHVRMPNDASFNVDAVNAVLPGRNHDLWIGTDGGGVIHQMPGKAENISALAGHENERIRAMQIDREGTLWIATQNGIERFRDGRLETVPDVGIIGGDITTVFADDLHDGMYFVTSSGLFHWRHGITSKISIPAAFGEPVAVYRDLRKHLWVGTMHGLLEVREFSTGNIETQMRIPLPSQVTILVSDRRGDLWVGTKRSGLRRWDGQSAASWTSREGLGDDTIRTLFVDDEDNLWIGGLTGGLARWRRAPFAPLRADNEFKPAYASITFADTHGNIWLGTWGQGLYRMRGNKVEPVNLPGFPLNTPIRSISEDIHGRILVGTWFNGIYSYNGGSWTHHLLGIESLVNAVSALYSDRKGGLWVGTYTGLMYFANGIPSSKDGVKLLPSKLVTDLLGDNDGSVLIATSTGLFRVRDGKTIAIANIPHPYVLSLAKDSRGNVWASSRTGGLARIQGDIARPLPADAGLPNYPVYSAAEDAHGHLWLGTSQGIIRVLASELAEVADGKIAHVSATLFGKSDGMPSSDCSGPSRPSATRTADGSLIFSTSKGFVRTTAFAENVNIAPPTPRILGWTFGTDARPENMVTGDKVSIDASETDINFHFDAKRLANPGQIEFRYRLAHYDSGWVTTRSRYARYRRISPGTYTFEVQARNSGDPWPSEIASVAVRQHPHFYNTYTFYMLVGFSVIALAAYLYTLRIRRVKGNIGIVLEERNRIARECHDTLMAGFAAISWQLEATSRSLEGTEADLASASHACESARSMVSHCQAEARRIIWDLRDTDEVTGVLSQALSRAISSHSMKEDVETRMAVEGKEILLPPASVHHLVCIGQEAVSNALRHGQPRSITVHLRYEASAMQMSIQDDGKGFSMERSGSRRGHFGLLVMQERARKIGGRFQIQSSVNRGTEVVVALPYASTETGKRNANPQIIRWIGL